MAEVNLFDASFQHSNEAAVAATPAVSDSMNHMSTTVASVNDGHGPNKLSETSSAGSSDQTKDKTRPDDDDNLEDAEKKRKRFLERNRVAAYKCRQKKKAWMQELEAKSEEATKRNRELHMLVNQLKEEAIQLKNQLLAHRNCDCNVIQQYVQTSGHFALAVNNRPPPTNPTPIHYMTHDQMAQRH